MTVDEFIVMAQRDRHPPYLTGGPRELGRHTDSFDLSPQLLVLPFNVGIACLIMGFSAMSLEDMMAEQAT